MPKNQEELTKDELKQVAGGEFGDSSITLLIDSIEKEIDTLSTHPLFVDKEYCAVAVTCLKQAKSNVIENNLESAFNNCNDAISNIRIGITSQPEFATLFTQQEDRIRKIALSIIYLIG